MPKQIDSMLDWALAYAKIGWAVLPVQQQSKRPLIKAWPRQASVDAPTIRAWWDKWPHANIGIHCGKSDLVVVDVDPRNDGEASLEKFEQVHGLNFWDVCQVFSSTGGGGTHYLFRHPGGRANLPGALGKGVDILHGDHFFVAAPSRHASGERYKWGWGINSRIDVGAASIKLSSLPPQVGKESFVADAAAKQSRSLTCVSDVWAQNNVSEPDRFALTVKIIDALRLISAECAYPDWFKVLCALKASEVQGIEDIARDWSATAPTSFDSDVFDSTWQQIRVDKEEKHISLGTLFWLADQRRGADTFDLHSGSGQQPFKVIPAAEFASVPQAQWLVRGLLPQSGFTMLYGPSGSGKSFFVLDMCMSIALGEPWRGHPVVQGKVVYVAAEGAVGVRKRLVAISREREVDLREVPLGVIDAVPNLRTEDDVKLADAIQAYGGAALIVVDTLASVTPGANENSSEDMGLLIDRCKRLHRATGANILLVHHSGKDISAGARGWSGLRGFVDTEIEMSCQVGRHRAKVSKQKDGEGGAAFEFVLESVCLSNDDWGEPVTSAVVRHVMPSDVAVQRAKPPTGAVQKIAMNLMQDVRSMPRSVLVNRIAEHLPSAAGKRDRRKERAAQAIESLIADSHLLLRGENIGVQNDVWEDNDGL